jgi:hypothetical protein
MRTFSVVVVTTLMAVVSGMPAPKLEGEALERALERLNAPEPWEKRDKFVHS